MLAKIENGGNLFVISAIKRMDFDGKETHLGLKESISLLSKALKSVPF